MKLFVGDKVAIKSWDELVEEFQLYDDENIFIEKDLAWFTDGMKQYCGRICTISELPNEYHSGYRFNEEDIEHFKYVFTNSMLKKANNREHKPAPDGDLEDLLGLE